MSSRWRKVLTISALAVLAAASVRLLLLALPPAATAGPPAMAATTGKADESPAAPPAETAEPPCMARHPVPDDRAAITGVVVTAAGAAVPDASVATAAGHRTTTDARGRFALVGLQPGEHWLRARLPGHVCRPAPPVRLDAGASAEVRLVVEPGSTMRGRIVSTTGEALPGCAVSAELVVFEIGGELAAAAVAHRPARWTATSDAGGRFALGPLPRGEVALTVVHPEHAGHGRVYRTDQRWLVVELERLPAVRGRLVDAAGRPCEVRRLILLASRHDERGPWVLIGEPHEIHHEQGRDGRFRLPVRSRRLLRVVAEGVGVARAVSRPFRLDPRNASGPLLLRSETGRRLTGRVVDDRGRPLPGVAVVVQEVVGETGLVQAGAPFALSGVTTDASGSFTTAPLAPSRYRLAAARGGGAPARSTPFEVLVQGVPEPIELILPRHGAILGRIADFRAERLPALWVRAVAVAPRSDVGRRPPRVVPVSEGRFRLDRLSPDRYRLEMLASDPLRAGGEPHVLEERKVVVTPGESTRVSWSPDLLGHGGVQGVLWVNGQRAMLVDVVLRGARHALCWTCTTDRKGAFRFDRVPAGLHFISAGAASHQAAHGDLGAGSVEVPARGIARKDVRLEVGTLPRSLSRQR